MTGTKYLGTVDADSEEDAKDKAWGLESADVCLCHQCAGECDDAQINGIELEPVK